MNTNLLPAFPLRMSLIVIALALIATGCAAEPWTDVITAETYAKGGKPTEAQKIVDRLLSKPDTQLYGKLAQAKILATAGKLGSALQLIDRSFSFNEIDQKFPVRLQLAYLRTIAQLGRQEDALKQVNLIGSSTSGMDRVVAADVMADIFEQRKEWENASDWIKIAVESLDVIKYSDEEKLYFDTLRARQDRIAQVVELLTHGLGLRLYRIGNEQRMAGQYENAVSTYERLLVLHKTNKGNPTPSIVGIDDPRVQDFPIHDVYAAAARMYKGHTLYLQHKYKEATAVLSLTIETPDDPYRGEALRMLGDLALADRADIRAAERLYTMAIETLHTEEMQAQVSETYAVPEKSRTRTRPPEHMRYVTGWGNTNWFNPEPQQIINASTCSWYVGYQTMLAQTQRAMCYFLTGATEKALSDLEVINLYDPTDRAATDRNMASNYLRLRDGFKSGRLYATQAELGEFSGKTLIHVVQAEILLETEQWSRAIAAYTLLLNDEQANISPAGRQYLEFAFASCHALGGNVQDAIPTLNRIFESNAMCVTHARAGLLLADLITDEAQQESILNSVRHKYINTEYELRSIMYLAQYSFVRGKYIEAKALFEELASKAPADGFMQKAAHSYLEGIRLKISSVTQDITGNPP